MTKLALTAGAARRCGLGLVLGIVLGVAPAVGAADLEEAARALLAQLAAGDAAAASTRFDERMRAALPPEKLAEVWTGVCEQLGPYQGIEGTRIEETRGMRIVHVTTRFEKTAVDTRVVFDATGSVAGLFFAPIEEPQPEWTPPAYALRDRFDEKPLVVECDGFRLPGFLALPRGDGPFPAVVFVHGSGPHDADETIGPNKPFRDLAGGLASQGVAVLRYTKRTFVMSQQERPALGGFTVEDETVRDALAAIALLRRTASVDSTRIFVLGHSLGGMLAPRIAARDGRLAGIVILAGNARPLEDLALEQVRYIARLDGEVSAAEQQTIDALAESVEQIGSPSLADTTIVSFLGASIPGSYWLDLRNYRPVETAAALAIPTLVLRGERDYQVGAEDFAAWQRGLANKRDAAFATYPALNHLFMAGTGEPRPQEYTTAGHVAAEVVNDIATWIADPRRARIGTPRRP